MDCRNDKRSQRIAVFASGNGSNFEALAQACADGRLDAEIALLVVDKPEAKVIERGARFGVDTLVLEPKKCGSKREYEAIIRRRMDELGIDLVCLAGYMRLIGPELLEGYAGKIINIHPSLLPSFKGAHAIEDAFNFGVKVFGVTIHYVDESLDGGRIIAQAAVPYDGDSIEELEPMIHQTEWRLYVDTVNKLLNKEK